VYKLLRDSTAVLRVEDGAVIPVDKGNADYELYLVWVSQGNAPLPADLPPPPSQDDIDAAAARQYAKLRALVGMTPAQVQAWVTANVTNLAQAQDAIMTLAIAVSILARRI